MVINRWAPSDGKRRPPDHGRLMAPTDKKALKAQAKAEKAAAKAAKAAEKEKAKVAKQEVRTALTLSRSHFRLVLDRVVVGLTARRFSAFSQAKESAQKTTQQAFGEGARPDTLSSTGKPDKAAQKAAKAAEKAKKQAEKELLKEQKQLAKAAKTRGRGGKVTVVAVGQAPPAVQAPAWADDVDNDSALLPAGPKAVAADGTPAASKLAVTPLGGPSTPETADLVAFLNPVASVRNCWLQRRDKKCLVLYDHDSDSFLACARLVQSKVRRDQFWRIYRSPQAMTCDQGQLTKEPRLAYVGKLVQTLSGPGMGAPDKFELYDQRTDAKREHLLITLKKKKKAAAYKVRGPNMADRIYRSTEPTYNKATKVHTYPQMTLENAKESIKNFVLQLEDAAQSAQPAQPPAVEMGKRLDDEWDLRVRAPFSIYQAFGMAVAACYGT